MKVTGDILSFKKCFYLTWFEWKLYKLGQLQFLLWAFKRWSIWKTKIQFMFLKKFKLAIVSVRLLMCACVFMHEPANDLRITSPVGQPTCWYIYVCVGVNGAKASLFILPVSTICCLVFCFYSLLRFQKRDFLILNENTHMHIPAAPFFQTPSVNTASSICTFNSLWPGTSGKDGGRLVGFSPVAFKNTLSLNNSVMWDPRSMARWWLLYLRAFEHL